MPRITHFAFTFAVTFLLLLANAQAQTPSIDVITDSQQAQFAAQGEVHAMRVEVYAPSGEMVFDSGPVTGQAVEWKMRGAKGERVADGVYLAMISIKTEAGKMRKRIEQITVRHEPPQEQSSGQSPDAVEATITGSGTNGKIAKFTGAATIGDSVITEGTNRIGINVNPAATLQVGGIQPVASANNGTAALTLLQTSGGKGGNTTTSGKTAGEGASISLVAGNGGNAVGGSTNGGGGSITLQPGSGGTGGTGGAAGNVLIAPTVGNVGIGTNSPQYKLDVRGTSSSTVVSIMNDGDGASVDAESDFGSGVRGFSNTGIGVWGQSPGGYAGLFSGKVNMGGDVLISHDKLLFGSSARQMINLFDTRYGIGIQSGTLYQRTNGGFAWFKGGMHNDAQNDPGGGTLLMRLSSGGNLYTHGAVNPSSDRNMKANFSAVNSRLILDHLASIPIQTWNYKSESADVRHIGPVAQDFRAAFNLGADDKHIATVDADGIALAAIQGLYQQNQKLLRKVEQLQSRLNQVERIVRKRRTTRRR